MKITIFAVLVSLLSTAPAMALNATEVNSCVYMMKHNYGLTNDQSAKICAGVSKAEEVNSCVYMMIHNYGMTVTQYTLACTSLPAIAR